MSGYRHRTWWTLASVALLVAVLACAGSHGENGRRYAAGSSREVVDAPEKAYRIWQEKGVRGRTLILFDAYPHNMGYYSYNGEPRLLHSNLVEYAIFQNVVRRIYFVVPEEQWSDFRSRPFVRPIREATEVTKGLYLYNQSGIPLVAVTPSSLPELEEKALVYVNSRVFPCDQALALLAGKGIASDITVCYGSAAP